VTIDAVVKLGGGLLARASALDEALAAIVAAASGRRLVVVPGGGPFADAVRTADARFGLPDAAAHWMAVLAMDQYAHLLASRRSELALVRTADEAARAIDAGRVPVLAPAEWLRAADPLPHSWDVSSDSIAAWLAGALGARRLVLLKPDGVRTGAGAVDAHFSRALPAGVAHAVLGADRLHALASALDEEAGSR
jgi:dihydroneopterin aldolase